MPLKVPLDKLCWEWAEVTDSENVTLDHVKTAYRLNLPPCKLGKCRRHCKGNPYCINCIGERVWFNEIDDSSWHDVQDPECERRKEGMSVGLKNLGATCYVNTFLQLWYHNETVKQGIFEWRDNSVKDEEDWKPDSVCGHLQVIFGLLEKSIRRYIDPSDFIHHLGLDAGQQQDAQEFSKLFLSVLEQNLSETSSKRNVIQEQFCGSYAYVTRCSHCKSPSERLSDFYELDLNIQGHKTLNDALKGFLEEEKLEGDNKYMCSKCNEKQNAIRAIELKTLPPVLNLQLLRFVYDLKTGSKKKLNSIIQFPEELDMSIYLKSGQTAMYELSAVLIHRGPSANSGHYVAHIRDQDSQGWYKFNDEEIEKIKGKTLQLGNEEDLEGKQKKNTKTPKGFVSSRNAYMLVYTRISKKQIENGGEQNSGCSEHSDQLSNNPPCSSVSDTSIRINSIVAPQFSLSVPNLTKSLPKSIHCNSMKDTASPDKVSISPIPVPLYVSKFVERDNEKFKKWVSDMNEMKAGNIAKGKEKQETVRSIFQDLPFSPDTEDNFEWIPLSWLTKWLNDPSTAPTLEMSRFLCAHGKIGLEQSVKMKCVSLKGSDQLFSLYGGTQRFRGIESLCVECVRNRCKQIRTKQQISQDDKFISLTMKQNVNDGNLYWIGKSSFRSWRRLAMEKLQDEDISTREENIENHLDNQETYNGENSILEETDSPGKTHSVSNSPVKNGSTSYRVNGTLGVEEQTLSSQQSPKNSIQQNEEEVETLQFNEDLLCEYHRGLEPDVNCRKLVPECVWVKLKQYFPDCPEFDVAQPPCEYCLSTLEAENQDKEFNKKVAASQKASLIDLFCDRKRPASVSQGEEIFVVSSASIAMWREFIRDPVKNECINVLSNSLLLCEHGEFLYPPLEAGLLKSDNKVTYVTKTEWLKIKDLFSIDAEIRIVCLVENDRKEIITIPKVCDDCLMNRLSMEERQIFQYNSEPVYIRKISKVDKKNKIKDSNLENIDDPDFSATKGSSGRKRSLPDESSDNEPPEKLKKIIDPAQLVRKSQRHRRVRGEKEVTVTSSQTLKDLKIQIMRLFSVPPFDQNLYVNGILLSNNDLTLGELKVAPGSVINLIADEADEETTFLEDVSKNSGKPEAGFKGTNLLSAP